MKKWQFDKQFLERNINEGIILLNDNELDKLERIIIKNDLKTLKQYLTGDFESYNTSIKNFKSLEKLKKYVLIKAQNIYITLGKELIDWIIDLNNENPFYDIQDTKKTKISISKQVELTLKNYENNSKYLLNYAKQILSSQPTSQIQIIKDLEVGSYCHYSDIAKIPLILIDTTESPNTLNHETQHAIEYFLPYKTHEFFNELGAIYFELLFLDLLFNEQGFLYNGDYGERLQEVSYEINTLAEYFELIKIFAKYNFNIETKHFINLFEKYMFVEENKLIGFLNEEIASESIEYNILYLLSSLKAIELRNKNSILKTDSINILKPHIKYPKFNFNIPDNYLKIYELYIEEMKQKTKKKRR